MYFKQILHEQCGCCSYLVASRQSNEAAVIDPFLTIEPYLELAEYRDLRIRYVIDTHTHADHVSGNRRLAEASGGELCLHESADVRFPFRPLRDGEELRLGQLILKVLHTPGHRPESISITLTNPPRSPSASMVFSGDTLLVGDVGRPDFGGPEGASALYESIQSFLGFEDYMEAIIATNVGEAELEWAMPQYSGRVPEVTVQEAQSSLREPDTFLLDVREPWEYEVGRMPGAFLLPQFQLASRLSEVPRDKSVLVACQHGNRSKDTARFLIQNEYPRVTSIRGGTEAWVEAGFPVDSGSVAAT